MILIWSFGDPYVQRNGNICAIVVEGIMRTVLRNYFEFWPVVQEDISFKDILIWSSGSPLVQRSGTVCAILVEGIRMNTSVKLL